jgi:L-asparaginase/Glu-tRNA(Gln) amidotransferase subunit D
MYENSPLSMLKKPFLERIKAACDRGCIIVMESLAYEMEMVNDSLKALLNMGVIFTKHMTTDCIRAKLMYLIGKVVLLSRSIDARRSKSSSRRA